MSGLKISVDGATRIIQVIEPPDIHDQIYIDVQRDLYSACKLCWRDELSLNKLHFPFRETFGGQDLGGGVYAGAYYFFDNVHGWRIRPYYATHELIVSGNLFGVNPDEHVFQPIVSGGLDILIRQTTSSLTQQVISGSGVTEQDKDDIADKVWMFTP